ncbi:hypothetical protein C8F04DRAFT_170273 [Mycena alexandri]|uniref:Uncharacterized protein n=1 Tax=Mycena alexandri TaxID=1745969 RepID=A0AAD6T915_9AGAR|nr:hypothetical protein C8F04DRAFT_170273 [Mycena alexandri]
MAVCKPLCVHTPGAVCTALDLQSVLADAGASRPPLDACRCRAGVYGGAVDAPRRRTALARAWRYTPSAHAHVCDAYVRCAPVCTVFCTRASLCRFCRPQYSRARCSPVRQGWPPTSFSRSERARRKKCLQIYDPCILAITSTILMFSRFSVNFSCSMTSASDRCVPNPDMRARRASRRPTSSDHTARQPRRVVPLSVCTQIHAIRSVIPGFAGRSAAHSTRIHPRASFC